MLANMGRPTSKSELIAAAQTQYAKLMDLIDSVDDSERERPLFFGTDFQGKEAHWKRDRNVRDILVHVYEWQQLLLNWVDSNQSGEAKPFIPEPYNWKTYGGLNVEFWQRHQSTSFDEVMGLLGKSHKHTVQMIERFTDGELFEKAHFGWTGTSSLGSYCVSSTSSHYVWATKKIRKHIRASKEQE